MKEHPILFSTPMVRAIIAGQKTVTRRLLKCRFSTPEHVEFWKMRDEPYEGRAVALFRTPWAEVVKAAGWKRDPTGWDHEHVSASCPYGLPGDVLWVREAWRVESDGVAGYRADVADELAHRAKWRPGIHLRRVHARLLLCVEDVRVERLHAIDDADALAEGIMSAVGDEAQGRVSLAGWPRAAFRVLWEDINGKRAPWASNPWLWRVAFRRLP